MANASTRAAIEVVWRMKSATTIIAVHASTLTRHMGDRELLLERAVGCALLGTPRGIGQPN